MRKIGLHLGGAVIDTVTGERGAARAAGPVATGSVAAGAARLGTEAATMPVVAAGLEGRLPEAKDFADAAVLILGMGVAGKAAGAAGRGARKGGAAVSQALQKRLQTIHGETGLTPERVTLEAAEKPALHDALLSGRDDEALALARQIAREREELATAYERVKEQPLTGNPDDVLATLSPGDIENVLVHRGPAVLKDGVIKVQGNALKNAGLAKRGFGLVKILFAHGEKGNKTPAMPPVTKEDVMALPIYLREYEPVIREILPAGDGITRWNIPRNDGTHLAIVVGRGQDGPDSRLVSVFVDKADGPASQKKRSRPGSLLTPNER